MENKKKKTKNRKAGIKISRPLQFIQIQYDSPPTP
jgi:hypothetical protein